MTSSTPDNGIGKKCKKCGLSASEGISFRVHKRNGEQSICRSCEAKIAQEYRKNNPDKIAKNKKRYHQNHRGTIKHHVQEKIATWRKASSVPSDLTVDYLCALYDQQDGYCYYSGEKMIFGWVDGKVHHNSLSLDKLDPSKGYVQGNVVWCTYLTNTMKQNMTEIAFFNYLNNLRERKCMYRASIRFDNKIIWQEFSSEDDAKKFIVKYGEGSSLINPPQIVKCQYAFKAFMGIQGSEIELGQIKLITAFHKQEFDLLSDAIAYGQNFVSNHSPKSAIVVDDNNRVRHSF